MPVTERTTPDPERPNRDPALADGPRRFGRRRAAAPAVPVGTKVASAGAGVTLLIARLIRAITTIVTLILVLGIIFVLLKASPGNTIVSHVNDWAKSLAGPFDGMFHLKNSRTQTAVNWGVAAVVYNVIGHLLAQLISTPHRAFGRRDTAV